MSKFMIEQGYDGIMYVVVEADTKDEAESLSEGIPLDRWIRTDRNKHTCSEYFEITQLDDDDNQ